MATRRRNARLGLTTSEVARELGVSLGTVRRWSDLGHLRAYRTPGGQRRFSAEQVEHFVRSLEGHDEQETAPGSSHASPSRLAS